MRAKFVICFAVTLLMVSCKKSSSGNEPGNKTPPYINLSVNVYNKGISGNTSAQLVQRVNNDVLSIDAKLVIILIGTNDVSQNVSLATYKANIDTLVSRIQNKGGQVLLLSPPPRGTVPITATAPLYTINNRTDNVRAVLNAASKQYQCYYMDVNAEFKKQGSPNATASSLIKNKANSPANPDGTHLTKKGIEFLATLVFNYLKSNRINQLGTIVCLGDSLTGGSIGYPTTLQKLLNANN